MVILSVFWVGLGSLMVDHSREHDFVSFYVGSTLALEGNFSSLYDRDAQFARQKEAAPNKDQLVPYVRPPFYPGFPFWPWHGESIPPRCPEYHVFSR